jgi:hypothetical protein
MDTEPAQLQWNINRIRREIQIQSRKLAGAKTGQVRVRDQSQDRQSTWLHRAFNVAGEREQWPVVV